MAVHRVNVIFETVTAVPADRVMNTFWIDDNDEGSPRYAEVADALVAFYDDIQDIYSTHTPQTGHRMEFYKMSDPSPRSPVASFNWQFTDAPTGTVLPLEVALCMSFQGAPSSGVNQQTRRGRIYLGPLSNITISSGGRPDSSIPPYIAAAGDTLLATSTAEDWTWLAYSTKLNTAVPVTNGWCDNEFDTQRRRGRPSTARSTFS